MLNTSFNFYEENDLNKLRKYIITKENEWKKDKAVLEQKNQLLELQLDDYKLRESNQRKLNETISQAITESSNNQKVYMINNKKTLTELQKNVDNQQKDHNKAKYKEQIKQLENQVRQLQEQLSEKNTSFQDMELQFQKQYFQYDHRISALEQEKQQYYQENTKLKEQITKIEDQFKSKEQQYKMQYESEIQKLKDLNMADSNAKQQDYEQRYQQLSSLYQKEKDQLHQRIGKQQNTIKRYQQHIEQNIDIQNIKQQHEEQLKSLKERNAELQAQFQYERQILLQQIDELKRQQKEHTLKESLNYHESTSKKRSIDAIKIKSSLQSYDSPVQCKSFHIGGQDPKIQNHNHYLKNSSSSSIIFLQKQQVQQGQINQNNQSFEKSVKLNEGIPMSIEQFNLMKNKKQKSQTTLSIPTSNNYNLNSYCQEASLFQQNQESFQLDSNNNQKEEQYRPRVLKQINPNISNRQQFEFNKSAKNDQSFKNDQQHYQRSQSQEGLKNSILNLSKMLGQTEIINQQTTQLKTNNTSLNSFKVPAFTQNQLNSLKNCSQYIYPCTTLRMNENHIQKVRYNNNHSTYEESKSQNKENCLPSKKQSKGNIKVLIGRLLQTKGKLSDGPEQQSVLKNKF